MKQQLKIFDILIKGIAVVALCVFCASFHSPLHAAADTSCDNEDNEFINQRLALCTVHAYNVGLTQNPETPADRQLMNDVVALKSTIMMQQMKRQYDFLDVTVKRFKTQLEKAILTAQMQAAGAAGGAADGYSTGGGGGRATSSYLNCGMKSEAETIVCVRGNLNTINGELSGKGETGTAQRPIIDQLTKDKIIVESLLTGIGQKPETTKCNSIRTISEARNCMQDLNGQLYRVEAAIAARAVRK